MDFGGTERLLLLGAAFFIEAAVGYPDIVYRRIGHPVTWLGALVSYLDNRLNNPNAGPEVRRRSGEFALAILVITAVAFGLAIAFACETIPIIGVVFVIVAASTLLAARSLNDHVDEVATALEDQGLEAGREMVARIVGRDTRTLDEAGVARAAIESLAENFSDGVTAPAFWFALFGLPGMLAYKAVNTADSMIGHKTVKHQAFGWASAKFDDTLNLPASRLTALLLIISAALIPSASARNAFTAVGRDAHHHRSPNAGWPEAAMAGALGLELAGPRNYNGEYIDDATMGNGRREATFADINRALVLYRTAVVVGVLLVFIPALIAY
ncbi:MAG: adenosylcobinamide-phosphate synthase CbiB [Hyphomicrobiaceae bacterium]